MKIGVISDSHDHMPMIAAAMDLFAGERVDAIIHAGDIVSPFAAKMLLAFRGPRYTVFGNNDGEHAGLSAILAGITPGPLVLELGGRRILVHHWIEQVPKELAAGVDVVITGHTHQIVNERIEGRRPGLILNPGECCGWLTGVASVAILDTESLTARIVTLATGKSWRI
ncbi:MAG: metallophosphoesterase [Phycisphaerae bacterium]|nr:metallophosphoesterase [Phycisphaerae bacterium]